MKTENLLIGGGLVAGSIYAYSKYIGSGEEEKPKRPEIIQAGGIPNELFNRLRSMELNLGNAGAGFSSLRESLSSTQERLSGLIENNANSLLGFKDALSNFSFPEIKIPEFKLSEWKNPLEGAEEKVKEKANEALSGWDSVYDKLTDVGKDILLSPYNVGAKAGSIISDDVWEIRTAATNYYKDNLKDNGIFEFLKDFALPFVGPNPAFSYALKKTGEIFLDKEALRTGVPSSAPRDTFTYSSKDKSRVEDRSSESRTGVPSSAPRDTPKVSRSSSNSGSGRGTKTRMTKKEQSDYKSSVRDRMLSDARAKGFNV